MSLIEYDLMGEKHDKVEMAIKRLQTFCPPEGYYLCFSGGKDSCVIKALADMAGVKYDAHYNATTVDPPELVRFIIQNHPDVKIEKPEKSMRRLIIEKMRPPSRVNRYCCAYLKESQAAGHVVVTGVRWEESKKRKDNQGKITIFNAGKKEQGIAEQNKILYQKNKHNGLILMHDNAPERRVVEQCYRTKKVSVNPIVEWTEDDVWNFIREYKIPYCSLYDTGMRRIGCIGCPVATKAKRIEDLERWPQYRKMYLDAFEEMLKFRESKGKKSNNWETGLDVMNWWLCEENTKQIDGQVSIDDIEIQDDFEDV